jgi:hypothetical protein
LLRTGLTTTADLWPPIQAAYAVVHQAAQLLAHPDGRDAAALQQAFHEQVLGPMRTQRGESGPLTTALAHFGKVTLSYWPGLFCCYDVPDLPHTNNDLEQYFGAARHLERRATGRKGASPALVVRGAVRVVALMATRHQPLSADDLRPRDVAVWKALRQRTDARHSARRAQARFRRHPTIYLAALEQQLLKPALPP